MSAVKNVKKKNKKGGDTFNSTLDCTNVHTFIFLAHKSWENRKQVCVLFRLICKRKAK